jgi:excisionase family DNA binding protein
MALVVLTPQQLEALLARAVHRALELHVGRDVLSTEHAAQVARRSPKTVRRWVSAGKLRAHRRGTALVIRRSDLEAFLSGDSHGVPADEIVRSVTK